MARISKELVDFNRSTDADRAGITLETVKESLANLRATIRGPTGTPYEGGVFVVQITVPSTYPFEPPKMKFETRVWHPNVSSQTGAICLSTLKDDCEHIVAMMIMGACQHVFVKKHDALYGTSTLQLITPNPRRSPALTIKTALLSLQALLSAPEPNDPQDAQVASQYKKNYKEWEATAKFWTESYAKDGVKAAVPAASTSSPHAVEKALQPALETLVGMGFDAEASLRALRAKRGNVEAALELLMATPT